MLRLLLFLFVNFVWVVRSIDSSTCSYPLDPLSADEISKTSFKIKQTFPTVPFIFILITLKEPKKSSLISYFLNDSSPPDCYIPRESLTILVHPDTGRTHEVVAQFLPENDHRPVITSWNELPEGIESSFSGDEMLAVGNLALNDPTVKARLSHYPEFVSNTTIIIPDVW